MTIIKRCIICVFLCLKISNLENDLIENINSENNLILCLMETIKVFLPFFSFFLNMIIEIISIVFFCTIILI